VLTGTYRERRVRQHAIDVGRAEMEVWRNPYPLECGSDLLHLADVAAGDSGELWHHVFDPLQRARLAAMDLGAQCIDETITFRRHQNRGIEREEALGGRRV